MSINVTANQSLLSRRVAAEIRAEMGRKQITVRALAIRVGRSPNWVSLRTSGTQTIDLDDLAVIADALGVTVVDLFPRRDREVTVSEVNRTSHAPIGPVVQVPIKDRPMIRRPLLRPADNRPAAGPRRSGPPR